MTMHINELDGDRLCGMIFKEHEYIEVLAFQEDAQVSKNGEREIEGKLANPHLRGKNGHSNCVCVSLQLLV